MAASSAPPSSPAAPSSSSSSASLAALRALSPSAYISLAGMEAGATAVACIPAIFTYCAVDGVLTTRYPRPVPGMPAPPIPQTFGGLLAEGLKVGVKNSLRTMVWITAAATLGAAGREVLHVGARYPQGKSPAAVALTSATAGAVSMAITTLGVPMSSTRRYMYLASGGVAGVLLPFALGALAPAVRARWRSWLPASRAEGDSSSSGEHSQ